MGLGVPRAGSKKDGAGREGIREGGKVQCVTQPVYFCLQIHRDKQFFELYGNHCELHRFTARSTYSRDTKQK